MPRHYCVCTRDVLVDVNVSVYLFDCAGVVAGVITLVGVVY